MRLEFHIQINLKKEVATMARKERETQAEKRKSACKKKRTIHGGTYGASSFIRKKEDLINKKPK